MGGKKNGGQKQIDAIAGSKYYIEWLIESSLKIELLVLLYKLLGFDAYLEWNWSVVCLSSESLGKIGTDCLKQTVSTDMGDDQKQTMWSGIESYYFIWFDFHSWGWCHYIWRWKAEEKMRWAIAGRLSLSRFATDGQVVSASREIRSLSSKDLDKILNSHYVWMCQSKSLDAPLL